MNSRSHLPPAIGSQILGELNDLKRTPQACADEIGWRVEDVEDVLNGRAEEDRVQALIDAITRTYPVRPQTFISGQDDTDDGVLVMTHGESIESQRVFDRLDASGLRSPYYEYRDTAISRLNGLRPEWIRPLRFTQNVSPINRDVAMNNGHLLHQLTFFAGDINFYFEEDGEISSSEMKWGDSNYIPPFIPHSFTTRDPEAAAFIVAVTFAGPVKKALNSQLSGDAGVWRRTLQRELMPWPEQQFNSLHHRMISLVDELGDMASPEKADAFFGAETSLDLTRDAQALVTQRGAKSVHLCSTSQTAQMMDPRSNRQGIRVDQLAAPPGYLEATFLHIAFCGAGKDQEHLPLLQFTTYRGVYLFCLAASTELTWIGAGGVRSTQLNQGDSVFVKSLVPFTLFGSRGSEVVAAAIPGDVSQATLLDLQHHHDIERAMRETQTWFD